MADDGERGGLFRRLRSVRVRITLAAALVTAVAVALAGWLVIWTVENNQLGEIHADAKDRADEVADRLEQGVDPVKATMRADADACADPTLVFVANENSEVVADSTMAMAVSCGKMASTRVLTDDGTPAGDAKAGSTGSTGPLGADAQPLPPEVPTGETGVEGRRLSIAANGDLEVVRRDVTTPDGSHYTVLAAAPVDEVARSLDAVRSALWVLFPGLVGVVALVAWWLAGRALRPVEAIRVEAEEIGGSTIHRRLPEPRSDDEIGRLARTMNAMLGRLEDSAVKQRQFVADASHELKSPVAAIRTDLEVALHEGERADWPTVAQAVLAEESRLETLLGDLLVLASDEEAGHAVHPSTVDLAPLAEGEAARARRVPVTFDISDVDASYLVFGNAPRLERVLSNLLDNAARHAEDKVRLTLSNEGGRVRVVVDDDGAGIAPIDRERIFERFTRLDSSRARDRGGAGLGLAVVRSIATRHGGYVWADQSPLGGARFTLELPAVPAP